MEQIESQVFTKIKTAVTTTYTNALCLGEYTPTPNKFPCVFVEEADNYAQTLDGSGNERVTAVMYEVNVYSNKASGKKTECKAIIKIIDDEMLKLGFTRTMCQPIPNEDITIYRMTARYSASISNGIIYRR